MKNMLYISAVCLCLLSSCYERYDADIEAGTKILVVDGLITNEFASYIVKLKYASVVDTADYSLPVHSARVTVTDDKGNYYLFSEFKSGYYRSDSLKFTGQPGRIYTLNIATPDGEIYRSSPQILMPAYSPSGISTVHDFQETIDQFTGMVSQKEGAKISIDIESKSQALPQFRITSDMMMQYFYTREIPPPVHDPPLYSFYCWQTDNANTDVNITGDEKSSGGMQIRKHEVCFARDQIYFFGVVYNLGPMQPDLSYKAIASIDREQCVIKQRILYLNLYSLNDDSYKFYKSVDEQLRSEGRLFDPIAVQLSCNVKCVTRQEKKVFGFFEASSVTRSAYSISIWNPADNSYIITRVPCFIPYQKSGCWINRIPPFWIK